jgi:predicted ATPase/class 3 adenylate cyclase
VHDPIAQLQATIAALQAQRSLLGDLTVDTAVAALREKIAQLETDRAGQQLGLVSVMFADVVGSTDLSRHLDPEAVSSVVDGALARFTDIVLAHDGKVLQYAGDNLLAVFGMPLAREDDAERAVRAGLAITALGRALGEEVLARHGRSGFNVRVGIHSGDVLLGGGVDGANSVRGLTPNIAARMEQTAPAGGLRISQDCYRLVRGRFDLRAQPPIQVKGVDQPMATYLVLGELRPTERLPRRGVEGVATRLVGRQTELTQLMASLQAVAQPDDGVGGTFPVTERTAQPGDASTDATPSAALHSLWVVGEAGLGKSRLIGEFRRQVEDRVIPVPRWLPASASEPGRHQPYALMRSVAARGAGLLDGDGGEAARHKWLQIATPALGEAAAAVLGQLLGLDFADHPEVRGLVGEPRQLRDRAFFHATQLLRAWSQPGLPLVLILDDLHWADDGSLDFLEHLHQQHADLPLLLIGLTRPDLFERRPGLKALFDPPADNPAGTAAIERLDLAPLSADSARELLGQLLQHLASPAPDLEALLLRHAEGSPFHLEELVNLLLDRGVISCGTGTGTSTDVSSQPSLPQPQWEFHADRLQAIEVPPTLAGVLRARLDALPQEERRLAQLASVIGFRFWDASLAALDAPALTHLDGLIARDLAHPHDPASLDGLREYEFKHQSLHEVAYASVLRRVRRDLHARVAEWLLTLPGQAPLELVAEHFEQGGRNEEALEYWHRAAEAALNGFANMQALFSAERGIRIVLDESNEIKLALLLIQSKALEHLNRPEERLEVITKLEDISKRTANIEFIIQTIISRSRYYSDTGDETRALEEANLALSYLKDSSSSLLADALARAAQCHIRLGRSKDALELANHSLKAAREHSGNRAIGMILNDLGIIHDIQGNHLVALEYYQEALDFHTQSKNHSNAAGTLTNIGFSAMMLGDFKRAKLAFSQAVDSFRNIGNHVNECVTNLNLAIAELSLGNAKGAKSLALSLARKFELANSRHWHAYALRTAGIAAIEESLHSEGIHYLESATKLFQELQIPHLQYEAVAAKAIALVRSGMLEDASHLLTDIINQSKDGLSIADMEEPLRFHWHLIEISRTLGDHENERDSIINANLELTKRASSIPDKERRELFLKSTRHNLLIAEAAESVSYL